jgi:hypothetical protein
MNDKNQQQDWGSPFDTPAHWSLKMGPIINNQNRSVYLSIVWMLGAITIISLVDIIGLSVIGKEIPQALIALGSVAVGALGSLFTPSK